MGTTLRFTIEHVKETIEKIGDKLLSTSYKNYRQKLEIICHTCNKEYKQSFQMILKGYFCTEDCKTNNYKNAKPNEPVIYNKDFVKDVKNVIEYNNEYTLISKEYIRTMDKLEITCNTCDNNFNMSFYHFNVLKQRCPMCHIESKTLNPSEFIKTVNERGDTLLSEFTNSRCFVDIKCGKCNIEYNILANGYRQGSGCLNCVINNSKLPYETIKERIELFGDILLSKDYINTKTPLQIQCGNCDKIFEKMISNYSPFCKFCNSTSYEKYMMTYLYKNNIEFTTQKTYKDCLSDKSGFLRFDFYIPHLNVLLETDGEQHFKYISHFGDENSFEKIKKHDKIKTQYCIDNDINLIRISYKEMSDYDVFEKLMDKYIVKIVKKKIKKKIIFSNKELYSNLIL